MCDAELLDRWRKGDKTAGRELFVRHQRSVVRVFRFKADEALDDLVQNTFLSCLTAASDLRDPKRFRAFLLGIARIELLRYLERRNGPRGRVDPLQISIVELETSIGGKLDTRRRRHGLATALRRLPIDLQIALELFYWEGMTSREIAEVLAIPEGTARSRLRLARERLRVALQQADGVPVPAGFDDAGLDAWARSLQDAVEEDRDSTD
jgi:RNA polymerase sigma-70 factor (ECF subfamily)